MRFLVVFISGSAALTFIAASALMNFAFMTSLRRSAFEQQILGAVSIAASAFLALLPALLLWAWRERRLVYLALGLPVFAAFGAFSLSSAVGFSAKNRGIVSEDRALATARLDRVRGEMREARAKLKSLGTAKSAATLLENLHAYEQNRRWPSSKSCLDATADASRTFCKGYFELKAELARANEGAQLDERIGFLKEEFRRFEEQGAGREADSQAAVLGRLVGLEAPKVERGMMLFLAALVEAGAALGLYFATGHMRFDRRRKIKVIDGEVIDEEWAPKPRELDVKRIGPGSMRRVRSMTEK